MANGRCRMHGGSSTGAPCGKEHGKYINNGLYTKEAKAQNEYVKCLIKATKDLKSEIY